MPGNDYSKQLARRQRIKTATMVATTINFPHLLTCYRNTLIIIAIVNQIY